MKNECNYVRDVLPLYIEKIVSEETNTFVKEHISKCPKCAAELEAMKTDVNLDKIKSETQNILEIEVLKSMKNIRKKFHKKVFRVACIIATIISLIVISASILLHFFPIYRLMYIGPWVFGDYYNKEQIEKALYIGSASDRKEAYTVLRLADEAFSDVKHTGEENEKEYGLLARYATPVDSYNGAAFNEHSLELWSAHLDDNEGWIWVYYSSETFNYNGVSIYGSWGIPSLWKIEKNDIGKWVVVEIREHP